MLEQIIAIIVTAPMIVALAGYIMREFFRQSLSRDIERYKADLQAAADQSKLRLENELQTSLFEFQTRFSTLHQKQAEAIGTVYGLVFDAFETMQSELSPLANVAEAPMEENVDKARKACYTLAQYYTRHRIYLPEDVWQPLDEVVKKMTSTFEKLDAIPHLSNSPADDWNKWLGVWISLLKDLEPLLQTLERAFRQSLAPTIVPASKAPVDSK